MMKTLKSPRLLAILSFASLAASLQAQDAVITDPNVEQAIRDEIRKPNGTLTLSDLAKVEFLDMSGMGLSTLTIPEGLVNLEELDVNNNDLAGSLFSPLKFPGDLGKLRYLDMSKNDLTSLGFLNGDLSSIEEANFRDNEFRNLTVPELLSNVTILDLADNENMTSLTLPEGFTNLVELYAGRGATVEINLPTDLEKLEILGLERAELTHLTVPTGIVSIREILLFGNGLETIELPDGMVTLEVLDLFDNDLKELYVPDGLGDTLGQFDVGGNDNLELVSIPEVLVDATNNVYTQLLRWQEDLGFEFEIRLEPRVFTHIERLPNGATELTLMAPVGLYQVYRSLDAEIWTEGPELRNETGVVTFTDNSSKKEPQYFWRAQRTDRLD